VDLQFPQHIVNPALLDLQYALSRHQQITNPPQRTTTPHRHIPQNPLVGVGRDRPLQGDSRAASCRRVPVKFRVSRYGFYRDGRAGKGIFGLAEKGRKNNATPSGLSDFSVLYVG